MTRGNPIVAEVLLGLTRHGTARLDNLGLLALEASALFVLWPKGGVDELLASQHSPYALSGVIMAMGLGMAYIALRTGAERVLLPGQHGLREWTLSTSLSLGRILRGYLTGQVVHSVHLLVLSSPLVLVAFTVSGGEWAALGWCVAAAVVQAVFYRLCGALTCLTIGQHATESLFVIRTILVVIYVPLGWLAPVTSHLAFTFHTLNESAATPLAGAAPDPAVFIAIYAGPGVIAALVLVWLLARMRRRAAGPDDGAGLSKAIG